MIIALKNTKFKSKSEMSRQNLQSRGVLVQLMKKFKVFDKSFNILFHCINFRFNGT